MQKFPGNEKNVRCDYVQSTQRTRVSGQAALALVWRDWKNLWRSQLGHLTSRLRPELKWVQSCSVLYESCHGVLTTAGRCRAVCDVPGHSGQRLEGWVLRLYLVHLLRHEERFWGLKHGLCVGIMEMLIVVTSHANETRTGNFFSVWTLRSSVFSITLSEHTPYGCDENTNSSLHIA
jgi:hypothetical protein